MGDVEVGMTYYEGAPTSPFTGQAILGRYYNVTPENGPGPYTINGGVNIRLYFTEEELADLNAATGENVGWEDLIVTHYEGENTDCSLDNSTGEALTGEVPDAVVDYGGTAHYLEFTTTSFSEFGAIASSAFPVELRSFSAAENGPVNALDWTSEVEQDFDYYGVERSTDGHSYVSIGEVPGRGPGEYSFEDPSPSFLTYYRLRLVDADGSVAYSDVRTVQRSATGGFKLLSVDPNPIRDRLRVSFTATVGEEISICVIHPLGRQLLERKVIASTGESTMTISLLDLPTGPYLISLSGRQDSAVRMVVKQ